MDLQAKAGRGNLSLEILLYPWFANQENGEDGNTHPSTIFSPKDHLQLVSGHSLTTCERITPVPSDQLYPLEEQRAELLFLPHFLARSGYQAWAALRASPSRGSPQGGGSTVAYKPPCRRISNQY